jgi:hypothetical protein
MAFLSPYPTLTPLPRLEECDLMWIGGVQDVNETMLLTQGRSLSLCHPWKSWSKAVPTGFFWNQGRLCWGHLALESVSNQQTRGTRHQVKIGLKFCVSMQPIN